MKSGTICALSSGIGRAGVAVIRRAGQAHHLSPRLVVGGIASLVSTTGLVHLAGDSPPWGSTTEEFSQAGGVLGLIVGGPLLAVASFIFRRRDFL